MTLTDFLLARIAEDEATAQQYPELGGWQDPWELGIAFDRDYSEPSDVTISPARVLAECEAMRRIVALHGANEPYHVDPCDAHDGVTLETVPCDTLRTLAAVYADHPDYREEWRP